MRRSVVGTAVATTGLDVCCVLAFVVIGRSAHHDGDSLARIWHTGWPFLAGLTIGLVAAGFWRHPLAITPTGIAAWIGAAGAGMTIRVLAGQGTAAAFIGVTFAFLALFLLGWRAAVLVSGHLRHTGPASSQRG
jgi:Protein of unknown function (DUF3054)